MKTILIYDVIPFKVDDEDFEKLSLFKWRLSSTGYPALQGCSEKLVHNILMPAKRGYIIDHIDRNKLNNQKSNLRYVTYRENRNNSAFCDKNNLPNCVTRSGRGYRGQILINKIRHFTKTFYNIEETVAALNEIRQKHNIPT